MKGSEKMKTEQENKEKELSLEELAKKNFSLWNESLLSKDPQKVSALYADDASFLPTLNSELKRGRDGAEKYFEHFLEKNPEGTIIEEEIKKTSADENGGVTGFLHTGMYNFTIGESDNRQTVEARFTFLWVKNENGTWEIQHHHSSLKPND